MVVGVSNAPVNLGKSIVQNLDGLAKSPHQITS